MTWLEIILAAVVVMMLVAEWRVWVALRDLRKADRDLHHREDRP